MMLCRIAVVMLLLWVVAAATQAGDEIGQLVRRQPVWIPAGLSWDRDPGEQNQDFATGTILYFGENRTFGIFGGTLLRHGKRLALSEGEGRNVYSGIWTMNGGEIQIDYRLVDSYKAIRPKGEKPPEIPGPLKHDSIVLRGSNHGNVSESRQLQFQGINYEAAPGFRASELRHILESVDRTGPGRKNDEPIQH